MDSVAALRRQANAFMAGRPLGRARYWVDMLASAAVAYGALGVSLTTLPPAVRALAIVVGALAAYRGVYFVHEIVHQRRHLGAFELVWHALFGFPTGVPSFMVDRHADHHRGATYGTHADPEYAPVAQQSRLQILGSIALMPLVPPALALRWLLVAPLSWLVPPLARLSWQRLSTLAINPDYVRPPPLPAEGRRARQQERAATLFAAIALPSLAAHAPRVLLHWWAITALALTLNQIKTLLTHAFELDMDAPPPRGAQLDDSVTIPGGLLTELWLPLGNRHHALHHLAPQVPYHQLEALHRHLRAQPGAARYRATERAGVGSAWRALWRRAASRQ